VGQGPSKLHVGPARGNGIQVSDGKVAVQALNQHLRKEHTMKKLSIVVAMVMSFALCGCAGMSDTEKRTLGGGAIGAGTGALVGAMAGEFGWGAVIGAAAGMAGGYIYDQNEKSKEAAYQRGYQEGKQSK
jgi:hypothetical protein